jgi:hypothetical protein
MKTTVFEADRRWHGTSFYSIFPEEVKIKSEKDRWFIRSSKFAAASVSRNLHSLVLWHTEIFLKCSMLWDRLTSSYCFFKIFCSIIEHWKVSRDLLTFYFNSPDFFRWILIFKIKNPDWIPDMKILNTAKPDHILPLIVNCGVTGLNMNLHN